MGKGNVTAWGTQPGHKIHGLRRPESLVLWQEFIIKTTLGARQSIQFREANASFTVRMRSKVPRKAGVSSITLAIITECGCALPTAVDQLHSVANG